MIAMSKNQRDATQHNRLLSALEPASRKRIAPHLVPVKLTLGAIVCEAGGLLKDAYFPEGAVLSLLVADRAVSPARRRLPASRNSLDQA